MLINRNGVYMIDPIVIIVIAIIARANIPKPLIKPIVFTSFGGIITQNKRNVKEYL